MQIYQVGPETDRQTDIAKLIEAFHNFANSPKTDSRNVVLAYIKYPSGRGQCPSFYCVMNKQALGIKTYYANLKFFKSRLVTKGSKLKLYRTVIRPIVTYASETWVLKENIILKLLVFERKILRGIFGPTKENQTWRIKNNEELDKLIKHENIVNYFKTQILSWFGHI